MIIENCKINPNEKGANIFPYTNDPIISFHLEKPIENPNGIILTFKLKTNKNDIMEIFWDDSDHAAYSYKSGNYAKVSLLPGENEYAIGINSNKIKNIRIDPTINVESVEISDMAINPQLANKYTNEINILNNVSLKKIQFKHNILSGEVNNSTGKEGMMCIPFGYSKAWILKVNDNYEEIDNINGGLIGFKLPVGYCKIELTYRPVTFNIGLIISVISTVILILSILINNYISFKRKEPIK